MLTEVVVFPVPPLWLKMARRAGACIAAGGRVGLGAGGGVAVAVAVAVMVGVGVGVAVGVGVGVEAAVAVAGPVRSDDVDLTQVRAMKRIFPGLAALALVAGCGGLAS